MPNAHLILHYPREKVLTYNVNSQITTKGFTDPYTGESKSITIERFEDQTDYQFVRGLEDLILSQVEELKFDFLGLQYLQCKCYFPDINGDVTDDEQRYIKRMNFVGNQIITTEELKAVGILIDKIKQYGYNIESMTETEPSEVNHEVIRQVKPESKLNYFVGGTH
jgi:hypothetical protein